MAHIGNDSDLSTQVNYGSSAPIPLASSSVARANLSLVKPDGAPATIVPG